MQGRRYPIHGGPGIAWVLVFEATTRSWYVERVSAAPCKRERLALNDFERTDVGKRLAEKIRSTIEAAADDA
jgi:hypothetical protein